MTTIVTRAGKGSALTHTELDTNFTNLNTDKVEASGDSMTGDLSFGDNNKAVFGAGSDLQIYHDGTTNRVVGSIDVTGTVTADGLTVDGTARIGNLYDLLIDDNSLSVGANLSAATTVHFGTTGVNSVNLYSNSTTRLGISYLGDISFYEDTGTTAKFFWDASTERLGIGTTSPSRALHAKSGQAVVATVESTSTSNARLAFVDANTTDDTRIGIGSAGNNLLLFTNNTERLRIDSSGNVGIGTASPAGDLEINGGGYATTGGTLIVRQRGDTNADGIAITSSNSVSHRIWKDASGNLNIGSSSYPSSFVQDTSGNVGIGTASPTSYGANYTTLALNGSVGGVLDFEDDGVRIGSIYNGSNSLQIGTIANGPLIFSTNNTERARIDSSGNLLVGKTTIGAANAGVELNSSGYIMGSADGSEAAYFNRKTSDGNLVQFRKDNSYVGSIGSLSGNVYITGASKGLRFGSAAIIPSTTSGTNSDATHDIGDASVRFRNLYLSSGVYLGGTGAANLLDDYEEGTFTPVIAGTTTAGTATYTNQIGKYTKIGNMVYANIYLNWSGHTGTGDMTISGLPFNAFTQAGISIGNVIGINKPANHVIGGNTNFNSNVIRLYSADASSTAYTGSNLAMDAIGLLNVTLVYRID